MHTDKDILIASITPYFLEKGNVWFEENKRKLIEAKKNQPFFAENILDLKEGSEVSLSDFLRKIDEFGYEKVFTVEHPGDYSRTGGVVEIFPVNMDYAVRVEWYSNSIERIEELATSIKDEDAHKRALKKRLRSQSMFSDLAGLKEGEYVVHLDHGVAMYKGIEEMGEKRFYCLEYAKDDRLFVPEGLEKKLSRYVGFTDPKVSRLSSPVWFKTKRKIRKEVEELAKKLLALYAEREVTKRPAYDTDGSLSDKLASTFPYEETPDQIQAIKEIKEDMSSPVPMDRLVCGDVGFGKTEIALRAMVMAAENGKQSALIAPTTILAEQHYRSFQERLKDTPIKVGLLSRFQSKTEAIEILEGMKQGRYDIVVGTHRLLSKDISFNDLGLLVIDDEQRFGVKQKERLRELRTSLDVLSLSATPIPRTMYMALSSLKGVSMVQTPPEGRREINTVVKRRSPDIIREAVNREISRGGQVYYLHNRIGTIHKTKQDLERVLPGARIGIAHAKLSEKDLMSVLKKFRNREYDILVTTTIIENGIDLANVNTIIIEDATKLGLAQAYQLKGRVGRSSQQAYAYFLYGTKELKGKAKLRIDALKEAQELGSGYRIALRDMEIRGAGNILGREQSGSVNSVGLNLYCQMLSDAVERQRS